MTSGSVAPSRCHAGGSHGVTAEVIDVAQWRSVPRDMPGLHATRPAQPWKLRPAGQKRPSSPAPSRPALRFRTVPSRTFILPHAEPSRANICGRAPAGHLCVGDRRTNATPDHRPARATHGGGVTRAQLDKTAVKSAAQFAPTAPSPRKITYIHRQAAEWRTQTIVGATPASKIVSAGLRWPPCWCTINKCD